MRGSRPLEEHELASALKAFSGGFRHRDRLLLTLGCRSGFRISELLSLRVGDVWTAGRIPTRVSVQRRHMKKKTAGRSVMIHPQAREAISQWLDKAPLTISSNPDAPLFPSRQGNQSLSRAAAWATLTKVFRKIGLQGQLGSHCMRKTFADRVYENLDRDIFATQKALGHQSVTSTTSYLSFKQESVDAAVMAA